MKLVFVLVAFVLLAELILPRIIAKYHSAVKNAAPPTKPSTEMDLRIWRKESQYRKERRVAAAKQLGLLD